MAETGDGPWFKEDTLRLPNSILWERSREQGLIWGPQLFLLFWFRKVIGWRLRPTYGIARPTRLPVIAEAQVPADILELFEPARRACSDAGLRLCFLTQPNYIGVRTAFGAGFVSGDGRTAATASVQRTQVGRAIAEQVTFTCHSLETEDRWLTTRAVDPRVWRSGLALTEEGLKPLPPETEPAAVLAAHFERIAGRSDLTRLDCDSLGRAVLSESQRNVDWRVEHGWLVPLSKREVQRLSRMGGRPAIAT